MRMLAGFFPPTSGRVLIDGSDLFHSGYKMRSAIGYLPENVPLYQNLTTEEFLYFVSELKKIPRRARKNEIETVVHRCDLESVKRRLIGKLSKGFKQRIGLAQALIGNPSVLILDEPTSGLDPKQIIEIRWLIRELAKSKTVIVSTHILPEVSMLCSRVLILHEGVLVASGTPDELGVKLRHSGELVMNVRGNVEKLEANFRTMNGIIAIRRENVSAVEHQYFIRYKKEKDIRSALSRSVMDSGLELLGLHEAPISLEEIFMKMVIQEESVKKS